MLAAFLVSFETTELGTFWPIYQGTSTLGRRDAADGLDIEIEHPTTSSKHATILASARPGRVNIEDLGSTNGVFVNSVRVARHLLQHSDLVTVGETQFRFLEATSH